MNRSLRDTYTNERIVYRTNRDVLTDQRLITGGRTFPLNTIQKVKIVSAPYFVPLIIARVVAFVIALIYVGEALRLFKIIEEPEHRYVKIAIALVLGGFAYAITWVVPTVSLLMTMRNGTRMRAMWGNDRGGLAYIVDEMRQLLAQHAPPQE